MSVTQVQAGSVELQLVEPGPKEGVTMGPIVTEEDFSESQSCLLWNGLLSEVMSSPAWEIFK